MMNNFKIITVEGKTFSFPLFVLENLAENDTDIVAVKNDDQMWLSVIDYLVFRECKDVNDSFYKTCKFKFKSDKSERLNSFQLTLIKKFHYSWLNHLPLWEYLNSVSFVNLLRQIAELRTKKDIQPSKDDVFKPFLEIRGTVVLPKTLTTMDNESMENHWVKMLSLC